jgi:FlaA1/EpsC-like NDP-sugar epimerase
MGATKRVAEKLIQSFNNKSKTCYMAVRFGNVLGSSGSAIPIFQNQINSGVSITITHPEMTRYFMSIQEASQLILQCGSFGKNGEIFLLEMGKPIKIVDMARDMIRLSGLEPDIDIPIVFTGLRPGEKLYEELRLIDEIKISTEHSKIMILKDKSDPQPWNILNSLLVNLFEASELLDSDKIIAALKKIIPSYSSRKFITERSKLNDSYQIKGEA